MIHRKNTLTVVSLLFALTTPRRVTAFGTLALHDRPGQPLVSSRTRLSSSTTRLHSIGNSYLSSLEERTKKDGKKQSSAARWKQKGQDAMASSFEQIKSAGMAGVISYGLVQLGFWLVSVPIMLVFYVIFTGNYPDFSDPDDLTKFGAEAFAYLNLARLFIPLRVSLALAGTPWVKTNIMERFQKLEDANNATIDMPDMDDA